MRPCEVRTESIQRVWLWHGSNARRGKRLQRRTLSQRRTACQQRWQQCSKGPWPEQLGAQRTAFSQSLVLAEDTYTLGGVVQRPLENFVAECRRGLGGVECAECQKGHNTGSQHHPRLC